MQMWQLQMRSTCARQSARFLCWPLRWRQPVTMAASRTPPPHTHPCLVTYTQVLTGKK